MVILSQRNPRWSKCKIGVSSLLVGRFGCTVTAMSMLTDYFGIWGSPEQIAGHNEWFTKDGLVTWKNLNLKAMKFEKRLYNRVDTEIMASVEDPDKAVILEVDYSHWVVCLGRNIFGKYRIADPWDGKKKLITAYGEITGSAHFIRRK